MLATFCLRLACGLGASLLLVPPALVNPRFFRSQLLIALALAAGAGVVLGRAASAPAWTAIGAALALAVAASVSWSLAGAPGGRVLIPLTTAALAAALLLTAPIPRPVAPAWRLGADNLTSAAVLGVSTTAMLIGHFYLIAPGMSLKPLFNLLAGLGAAIVMRMALAAVGLWSWTSTHSLVNLEDEIVLWLPLRWSLGFVAPLVLGVMAWQAARIRSTQAATGILYVVVIFCFLGEVMSQVLLGSTGLPM